MIRLGRAGTLGRVPLRSGAVRLGTAGGACRDMIRLGALGLGEARQAWQFWSGRVLSRRGEVWNGRLGKAHRGKVGRV